MYIINSEGIVYYPSENEYISLSGEYIIKPQGKCTLARDDIQGWNATLDDIHHTSCGDDIPNLRFG